MPKIRLATEMNLRVAGWYASNLSKWWLPGQRRPNRNAAAEMCAGGANVPLAVARGMLEYIMMPEMESVTMEGIDQGTQRGAQ